MHYSEKNSKTSKLHLLAFDSFTSPFNLNARHDVFFLFIRKIVLHITKITFGNAIAIHGVTPGIAVKARRVGGSTHQVPIEIGSTQGKTLAIRWLLAASRKRPGRNMTFKLSSELVDADKGSGDAIRKREETHRMAEANKAFAHFRESMNRIYTSRSEKNQEKKKESELIDIFLETNKKETKDET
ncbi:hypothetical protein E3N88_10981 [Mikania micrantha]|uniref:Small ribosomal subunit protein uS7 domain-containing protein n=1 Tax=Mikania micrantha TaxID=192012 RepID=A0A5N6PC56_9ASTR|nr:hypothetical protein E3N88_10981 [Mikania micrantha]